ncbi:MAG TPA: thioredoxin [Egibacteraceae bacterium]|nr:thioredoxin [Egibacteraceae bacterium]
MSDTTVTRDVTEAGFAAEVLETSRSRGVVVDFWAPWCGPCHQLAPVLERVAARYTGDVDLVKVNVDEAPDLARRYRVQGIPSVKAFRDGGVVAELTGVQPEAVIERLFAGVAPTAADRLVAQAGRASGEERERLLRAALDEDPGHVAAVTALARLLADRGEREKAHALLDRVPETSDVARLRAELSVAGAARDTDTLDRLRAAAQSGDAGATLELGRALAAAGAYEEAIDALLAAVRAHATRDAARVALLEVFNLLGEDHELVGRSRPKLASALF